MPGPAASARPAVVAAVIVDGNRVLLAKRRLSEGSLSWQFPGGEAEPGESAEQTAVRETREEVGLDVAASRVIGERTHPTTGRHMVYVACHVRSGTAHVADAAELSEITWSRLSDLRRYIPSGLYPAVQEHLDATLSA